MSTIKKRSIIIDQHKTSVSLEDEFWDPLKNIAEAKDMTLSALVTDVNRKRTVPNLSSALRIFVVATLQAQIPEKQMAA